jgi:hypothetical protein
MRGYDGSIRIDTKIDEKGFNKGIKNLGSQVKSLGGKMADAALGLVTGFTMAVSAIGLVIWAVSRLIKSIARAVNRVINMGTQTQGLKEDFEALKLSVRNAFLPLLQVALPLLQKVAQWLTVIFNLIGSVLAALMGQTEVMRATLDVTSDATSNVSDLADETERAEEAAEGALAGFDEIDVLQMEKDEPADTGGPSVGGPTSDGFTMEPISQKILDFVNNIKDFFEPLWEPLRNLWDAIKGLGAAIWNALAPLFGEIAESGFLEFIRDLAINGIIFLTDAIIWLTDWINNNQKAFQGLVLILAGVALGLLMILSPAFAVIAIILGVIAVVLLLIKYWPVIKEKAIEAWESIKTAWGTFSSWFITNVWTPLTTWAANVINTVFGFFSGLWESIKGIWNAAPGWFQTTIWEPLTTWAENVGISIVSFFTDAWEGIKSVFQEWGNWINTNVIEPVVDFFTDAWDSVKEGFENAFEGITEFLKGVINGVIDLINGLINGIVNGMNGIIGALNGISVKIPDWVPKIGGQTFGINLSEITAPQIPKLATGAVIPPNSQFLAVLGDQRSGRNIETPEGLMRQIVREEMQGGQEVTINFAGTLGALVRELKPYIDKENVRIGRSMVKGL